MSNNLKKKIKIIACATLALTFSCAMLSSCDIVKGFLDPGQESSSSSQPEEIKLTGIRIKTAPTKVEYKAGEAFDATGMVVEANYSDNTSKTITSYTCSPNGALALTDKSVVISYTEEGVTKTATQAISVIPAGELSAIEITTAPTKVDYVVGETFDKTGMIVTAKYTDETSVVITDFSWDPTGALTLEDTEVTISYIEGDVTKTATQAITVRKESPVSLSVVLGETTKMEYNLGDTFDPTGITVNVAYDNGTTKDVALGDCKVEPTVLGVNDTVVKVSYTEGEKTVVGYANKKILINAPEVVLDDVVVAEEILFSNSEAYELGGGAGKTTWKSTEGNIFDRLRANTSDTKTITFAHDYSSLADKSLAGFCAIMNNSRGGTVIQISTDEKATWTTLAEAKAGENMIAADYKYPAYTIDGKASTDGTNKNVYYCYYSLAEYLTEASKVYVKFSYAKPIDTWAGADVEGADLIHSFTFYDKIDLARISGKIKLAGLSVTTQPAKTEYSIGDIFDKTGLVLEATWTDGSKTEITSGYQIMNTAALTAEDTKIVVSYSVGGVTESVEIAIVVKEPEAQLVSIDIATTPTVLKYKEGEMLDTTGLTISATYDDDSTKIISEGFTVSPTGVVSTEMTTITVTYLEKTCTFEIIVLQSVLKDADKVVSAELMFSDSNNYVLANGAKLGADRYFNNTDYTVAKRLRCNKTEGAYIQFTHTYTEEDLSQAGFMFYGLHTRMGTTVQVSSDGENWTYLFKATVGSGNQMKADWKEKADNIVNKNNASGTTDGNMYSMYYDLSKYVSATNKTVYIRIGYENPIVTDNDGNTTYKPTDQEGADIFGSITFYSKLDLDKVR